MVTTVQSRKSLRTRERT